MNLKERNELRRRIAPEKCAISSIHGCFVNGGGEIVARIETPIGMLNEAELEKYFSLFRKVLSGTMGKNLIDIPFSTQQVAEGHEHKLLMTLLNNKFTETFTREEFYQNIIKTTDFGGQGYVILVVTDAYDVPYRGKDGEDFQEGSDQVFRYFLCAVCPVKEGKPELTYDDDRRAFHTYGLAKSIDNPAFGFLFPTFDDRCANIYDVLYYAKNDQEVREGVIDILFKAQAPMPAGAQKETFQEVLQDALEEECSYDVVQSVHEQMRELIAAHKDSKDPESLDLSQKEVSAILTDSGVPSEKVQQFESLCSERFGKDSPLHPENIISSGRFLIETPQVKVSVDPKASYLVETKVIGGKRYLLVPADEGLVVNGMAVKFPKEE